MQSATYLKGAAEQLTGDKNDIKMEGLQTWSSVSLLQGRQTGQARSVIRNVGDSSMEWRGRKLRRQGCPLVFAAESLFVCSKHISLYLFIHQEYN